MTNTITYEGRTFTLDEWYEHPAYGRLKFVGFYMDRTGYFRNKDGNPIVLRYDTFPLPGDDVWVRLSREDAEHDLGGLTWDGCERCRRVEAAITEALGEKP